MLPPAFMATGVSSFTEFLTRQAPRMLPPVGEPVPAVPVDVLAAATHGTTVLGVIFPAGIVIAGDRRGTMGNLIAQRELRKVHTVDAYTCVGFAGSVGVGVEFIQLFQLELEHYEKIEGSMLSFRGKTNRLATMLRGGLDMAMQGFAYVPLVAVYDQHENRGRVVSYDVVGTMTEARDYESIGSGSYFAKSALKKLYRADFTEPEAVRAALEALYDAADEDSATAGPDLTRRIHPTVSVVTAEGVRDWPEDEVAAVAAEVVAGRLEHPNGPTRI